MGDLAERLREAARDELAKAGRVTNPAFPSYWGADIIEAHKRRAALLREAAEALSSPDPREGEMASRDHALSDDGGDELRSQHETRR